MRLSLSSALGSGHKMSLTLAASGVRTPAFTQIGTFVVGTAFLVLFRWSALE